MPVTLAVDHHLVYTVMVKTENIRFNTVAQL